MTIKAKATTKKATARKPAPKKNVYKEITNSIIEALENGVGSWQKGWSCGSENGVNSLAPINATTGKAYTGINRLILGLQLMQSDYQENKWVTYKQAQAEGWHVVKGQKGTMLAFYGSAEKNREAGKAEEDKEFYSFLKSFTVFNVAQLEGYVAKTTITPAPSKAENNPLVQNIINNTDVKLLPEAGNEAFYMRSLDVIQMPPRNAFKSESSYINTLVHECIHSTLHTSRLDRDYKKSYEQKEAYAREELVAELGAAFLCSEANCISETLENHASYIGSWIQLLKHDEKAIFTACAAAQKATDFIMREWANKETSKAQSAA